MKISKQTIESILKRKIATKQEFSILGLLNSSSSNTLSFIDSKDYIDELQNNFNIKGVFATHELSKLIDRDDIDILLSEDPRYDFFFLLNKFGESEYEQLPSKISNSAQIHETSYVSPFNVVIGQETVIGPNVSILADVEIGNRCTIQAGASLGSEGFEYKRTSKGILPVRHDGKVIIKDHVDIGSNSCVDKGFSFRNTIIGSNNKIDNLVHIAHGVQMGQGNYVIACSMIAGSVTIHNDVWIGPNASIAPQINIANNAFISLGSVVTKDVKENEHVTGNFAIPHRNFLNNLKAGLISDK